MSSRKKTVLSKSQPLSENAFPQSREWLALRLNLSPIFLVVAGRSTVTCFTAAEVKYFFHIMMTSNEVGHHRQPGRA